MSLPSTNEVPQYTYCPMCGYDLCGLAGINVTCPECGSRHATADLLDPQRIAKRIATLENAITMLSAFFWMLPLIVFVSARVGKWPLFVLQVAYVVLVGWLCARYDVLKLRATLPRQVDRRRALAAAFLLFLKQLAWLGVPIAALCIAAFAYPLGRRALWTLVLLCACSASVITYDVLTFYITPQRRTHFRRILDQLKHRAGDRTIPPDSPDSTN